MIHLTTSRTVCRLHRKCSFDTILCFLGIHDDNTAMPTANNTFRRSWLETRNTRKWPISGNKLLAVFFSLLLNFCDNKISTAIEIFLALCEVCCSGIRLQKLDVHETSTVFRPACALDHACCKPGTCQNWWYIGNLCQKSVAGHRSFSLKYAHTKQTATKGVNSC